VVLRNKSWYACILGRAKMSGVLFYMINITVINLYNKCSVNNPLSIRLSMDADTNMWKYNL